MDFRNRLLAPAAEVKAKDPEQIEFLAGEFVERLLLFEEYMLESIRLKEIPHLVRLFGYSPVLELLKSGKLKIYCDAVTMASTGQVGGAVESRRVKGNLPLCSYCFDMVRVAYYKDYIHKNLQQIHEMDGISHKEAKKLKLAVVERLVLFPELALRQIHTQTIEDLKNLDPAIRFAIASRIQNHIHQEIDPNLLEVKIEFIDETDFRVESNIETKFGLDKQLAHKIVERGLLGIGRRNQRIAQMEAFNSLVGFKSDEVNLIDRKMDFLIRKLSHETYLDKFQKVLFIKGLPDFSLAASEGRIDLVKLLEVTESRECIDFRTWLWSQETINPDELKEMLEAFSQKFKDFRQTQLGKTIYWLVSNGLGFIPKIGILASLGLSFYDEFLAKDVLPKEGAITFINNKLPTVYKETQ
jgi:hypothetical protein